MPSPEIPPLETFARHLLQSNPFNRGKNCAKIHAFVPHPVRLDASVFQIAGLAMEKI